MEGGDHSWGEDDSDAFLRWGALFVPDRDLQTRILLDLIPATDSPFVVLELGCGAGLISAAVLERYPAARVTALDASATMLEAAGSELGARFPDRFELVQARIEELSVPPASARAVVSSLAVHHLENDAKRRLFASLASALEPGGVFLLADLILPAHGSAHRLAARLWDEDVERRARAAGRPAAHTRFRDEGWNMYALASIDPEDRPATLVAQLDWLREAGFARVDVAWMNAGHVILAAWTPGAER